MSMCVFLGIFRIKRNLGIIFFAIFNRKESVFEGKDYKCVTFI